jgi:uncharacterized protein YggE
MRVASVAFGLLVATGQVAWAQTQPDQPKIVVDGLGRVETVPDVATVTYTLRGEGRTSDDAVRAMVAMGTRIEKVLRSVDAASEPRTDKVEVSAIRAGECRERDYDPKQLSTGPCAIVGFVAEQNVSLKTSMIDKAGTLVGLAAREGSYNPEIDSFDIADPRPARQRALAMAVQDAASKAASVAAGSKVTLGPIISISSVGQQNGQDIVITGTRIPQANLSSPAPPPVDVNMKPKPIATTASVVVSYAIVR